MKVETSSAESRSFKKSFQSFLGDLASPQNVKTFLLIVIELSLLWLVVRKFKLERELGFPSLFPTVFVGFLIQHFLPSKYRLPFCFLLFVGAVALLVGIPESLIVTSVGLLLLFIAHLRLPYWLRILAIGIVASALAAVRLNLISTPWTEKVVPILASMFMFRFILYLFELKKGTAMGGWWQRITYFFMLPNICFPLFPIVDYQTFLSSHFNQSRYEIYQKGVRWMVWGTLQLLLYRVIYYFWVPDPTDVVDLSSLFLYCFTAYMLLLRIVGQAYLILGILCLFGWNLPPMYHLYFLASGFSDLWRRINTYWRSFMMKVFYYPVYFAIRRYGLVTASIASLLFAFFVTWILHSYQYFWIQGSFPLKSVDGVFWGVFGVSVAVDSFFQMRRKGRKQLGKPQFELRAAIKKSMQVVFFFLFMCLLFSFWGSDSISEWFTIVSVVRDVPVWQWGILLGGILLAVFLGTMIQIPFVRPKLDRMGAVSMSTAAVYVILCVSILITFRFYRTDAFKNSVYSKIVRAIQIPGWNKRDAELAERGYYEPLLNTNMLSSELVRGAKVKPLDWESQERGIRRRGRDRMSSELVPSLNTIFKNQVFTTNSFGMRDQEYSRRKPADTYRIALLGGSAEMGSGVADGQPFESIVEDRLNKMGQDQAYSHYEILNFAVSGNELFRYVSLSQSTLFAFQPDAVIVSLHVGTRTRTIRRLVKLMDSGDDQQYDIMKEVHEKSGYHPGMNRTEETKALRPYIDDLTQWTLNNVVERAHANHSMPICLILPVVQMTPGKREVAQLTKLATQAGYVTIDLSDTFDDYDPEELMVAPWDSHPNAEAHRLLADALYREILKRPELKLVSSSHKATTVSAKR